MTVRYYSSVATPTTLSAGINNSVTTISVGSVTGFPTLYPYTLAIDYDTALVELVEVTNAAGTTLTVTRAIDGTSATSHSGGAAVRHVASARDYQNSRDHEEDATDVHGTSGFVVGTNNTQTLTNKTLTTPTIASFVNATHDHGSAAGGGSTLNEITVTNNAIGDVPLTVNTVAGQTGQPFRVRINGTNLFHINSSGEQVTTIPGAASNFLICNTTSAFTGDFLDYKKDGAMLFGVNTSGAVNSSGIVNTGTLTNSGTLTSTGNISTGGTIGSTGAYTGSSNFNTGDPVVWPTVWGSTDGTPAIGNGTMEMTYVRQGRICHVWLYMLFGTSSTYGNPNNVWTWTLPFPWLSVNRYGGSARATESFFKPGFIQASGPQSFLITDSTGDSGFGWGNRNGIPFTTPIDTSPAISIQAQFTYEINA